jgi:TonB family protein
MSHYADVLDQRDSLKGAFAGAIFLHGALIGGLAAYGFLRGHTQPFGAINAGGAIGIEVTSSIALPHRGMPNPVASPSESEVPQTPVKEKDRVKQEKVPKDAVAIKSRTKKKPEQVASAKQRFRPFEELEPNQLTQREAPAVSNPLFAAKQGSGQVGAGENTTLGTRFGGYAQQIQQLVAQKWRTADVDASITTAPTVIATFDLLRNGSVRNVQILQRSGIASLDYSVQRAILEASPFPPIPPGFEKDSAKVEFWFELRR